MQTPPVLANQTIGNMCTASKLKKPSTPNYYDILEPYEKVGLGILFLLGIFNLKERI